MAKPGDHLLYLLGGRKCESPINSRRPNPLSHMFDDYQKQHNDFTHEYGTDIAVRITDDTYLDRLDICEKAIRDFIDMV